MKILLQFIQIGVTMAVFTLETDNPSSKSVKIDG